MLATVAETLKSQFGRIPSERILVGYSGGADSTSLLHVLSELGCDVVAAHLHHGQRPEADEEESRCVTFCDRLGVPIVTARGDVPRMASELKIGLEEAGRRARYAFFQEAAHQTGCDLIATGHTLDDHIESVLLHFARGSGLRGLGGIQVLQDGLLRPILAIRRRETRAYCVERGFWFHDDPANDDETFSRVRIRNRVVPEFESINSGFLKSLQRLAQIAHEEDSLLDSIAAGALERNERDFNGPLQFLTNDCEIMLDRNGLSSLPTPLLRRGLRLVARTLGAETEFDSLERMSQAIRRREDGSETLPGGQIVVEWHGELVHCRQIEVEGPTRFPLQPEGITESPVFGWEIEVTKSARIPPTSGRTDLEIVIAADAIRYPFSLRSVEPGDRMDPLGFHGTRKLSDLMAESKLTLAARRRLPIIQDMAGIVWVPGVCVANRVKLMGSEQQALTLRFGPIRTRLSDREETTARS